ncbi:MAG: type II toxin-antitoxin system RelE/ParE family toxin [Anaerovoracaceae bacterium]|jgi:hypothetical protein
MIREFVLTATFDKKWEALGLNDDDLIDLQQLLLSNPQAGAVVQNTGGLRKVRISLPDRGKRGGARVLYVDFVPFEKIYLITAYGKGKKENLTDNECVEIRKLIESLRRELEYKER